MLSTAVRRACDELGFYTNKAVIAVPAYFRQHHLGDTRLIADIASINVGLHLGHCATPAWTHLCVSLLRCIS